MNENFDETMKFEPPKDKEVQPKEILFSVYASLKEKGYNAIDQIIGYLLSGDPTYITSHNNARSLIRKLERDELLEEILKAYLKCDE
ncbi:IreB family regulatory phosphoprotein [Tissierella sp. Yu-01]|uniref:IreB family regulatory phosphoprotein n=1 Tax=Tissierella sp. Yu-01 TaxID=3035694 RepID=UPI00240D964C|nr:IreB family regulatory phosphoprotein [Tissierella sp. Yu-01]WFA09659.1 IreB family regulatory phosphoprotein [Tissierella sp. Yu-01]